MLTSLCSRFIRSNREIRFAVVHVTTRCNAKCVDRCNIWASNPVDMQLEDVLFTIDVLAKNNFSVIYFTGGETGLYPYLVEAVKYAKEKGFITSITTNGTISKDKLVQMSKSLDALSVSVDHYKEQLWDQAKHTEGIAKQAQETIKLAKSYGIKLYAITFLNPSWNTNDITKVVHYVNNELGVPFSLSYPYISTNDGTFVVGGSLRESRDFQDNLRNNIAKVLEMKLSDSKIANSTSYLRDVLRAHDGLPMKYPCKAGRVIITIDCKLNIFPCYKKDKMFNLRECQDLNTTSTTTSFCDNKFCMINCFKEASETSKETLLTAAIEEATSSPRFYLNLIR
jgi:MoaA/NifB/PqqE/SkfB family radical SAM enzyme